MRKHLVTILIALSLLAPVTISVTSCASNKLEPGGAYAPVDAAGNALVAPDYQFFVVDAAFALAHSTVDAAFLFEKNNRLLLWRVNKDIKHNLDKLRPQALELEIQYARARNAYLANPVLANLTQLQTLLGKAQQIAAAAAALLPVQQVPPAPPTASNTLPFAPER